MKLGAIDVGSNAIRVLIGDVYQEGGRYGCTKLAYLRLPVRLGSDVFNKGKISEENIDKLLEGMRIFKSYLQFYGVTKYQAVATSAMRDSANGKKITERIKKETGIKLKVISGKQEAELVYLNFQLIPDLKMNYVLIDVGGGSTEITLFRDNKVHAARSFQIGSVRLLSQKVDPKEWGAMGDWLEKEIKPFNPEKIYGSGGTINNVHKVLDKHERDAVTFQELQELKDTLVPLSLWERTQLYHIKPDRSDVIIPAMEVFLFIMNVTASEEIFVPKMGLSDGVLLALHRELIA
jgi:exopolyphosphatase/guanosine-5'-triphosphate,3'-diphosphate pyrophosphatase